MKMKSLAAALITTLGVSTASAAAPGTLNPVQVNGTSFQDLLIGTITIPTHPLTYSNIVGSLFAADKVGTPWGTWTLSTVTFSGGSLGPLTFNTPSFSFSNLAAGDYTLKASGSLGTNGQIQGVGFIGANYTITPVPEPGAYAMLLAGLGLMGFVARRRSGKL